MFQPAHVRYFREKHPGIKVIVHPECHEDVVNLSDLCGSTEFIIRTVSAAEPGSIWGVGTELNLVNRLKRRQPDKQVYFLSPTVCQCSTMFRIFFFSSRRRHTRLTCDWSSDVCSSDLKDGAPCADRGRADRAPLLHP